MASGSKLGQVLPGGHKGTVSGGGSAVHVVGAAVPANVGAAAGRAHGSITLVVSKLHVKTMSHSQKAGDCKKKLHLCLESGQSPDCCVSWPP